MPGFQKEYDIHYFLLNQYNEANPVAIINLLGDIAISHSEAVGLGIEQLLEVRTCWILNRWLLKMDRYPKLGEKLLIETWPSQFKHFYATREFCIKDTKGNMLGSASSLWIYLNVDKRRPTRIPQYFNQAYGLDSNRVMNNYFQDLASITDVQAKMSFHVRHSDIDTNGHVNNACYIDWMLEGISEDLTRDYHLSELEVIYKKETMYGADIFSECQIVNSQTPEYLHRITDESSHELALGRTVWKKR